MKRVVALLALAVLAAIPTPAFAQEPEESEVQPCGGRVIVHDAPMHRGAPDCAGPYATRTLRG